MHYNLLNWKFRLSAISKLIFVDLKNPKIAKISDTDWAWHIKMDYAQNFKKY